MAAEITTVVGQLNIVGGAWRGDAPNQVAVREPKSADVPGANKGDLFVLAEVRGSVDNGQVLERQLAETVRDTYYLARGSVTASLRRALQAASDLLYERNYQVSVEERVVGGVVALVMRDEDAFVARIGPTAFFAVLGDHIQRYPSQSAWLDEALGPESDEADQALGIRTVVEPNLHHLRVSPEDMLVLADSRLASLLPLVNVAKAVEGCNVKVAVKNLGKVARANDCSALVLAVIERTQSTFGPLKVSTPPQLNRFLPRQSSHIPATPPAKSTSAPEAVATPEPVRVEQTGTGPPPDPGADSRPMRQKSSRRLSPLAKKWGLDSQRKANGAQRSRSAGHDHESVSVPSAQAEETSTPPEKGYDLERQLGQEAKVLASMAPEPVFDQELHRRRSTAPSFSLGKLVRWLGIGVFTVIALLGNGFKAIFNLVLPGAGSHVPRQAGMQARRSQPTSNSWVILRNIAIAIPILVALIVGISYLQKGRIREAEYRELVDTAQNKFQQAQAVDRNSALGLINEAETLLVQAEQIKVDQPEIADLQAKMAEEADRLGNVQRLYYLPLLRSYTDDGTNLKSIIVQGVEIYVLDSGNHRLFYHRLDDLGETLLPDDETLVPVAQGQVVDEVTVGILLGMTWMPAGGNRQTSDLLILSSTGLLEYNANWGLTTAAITGRDLLVFPTAVSSFFGNFYILDAQANALLRYLPTADGYSTPPENYFSADQPVDLSGAIDFTIDGAIYVLFSDGHIGKYLSGLPVDDFNVSGLDKPFNNPVSIFTAPDEEVQHIYVADAGNQRVVQLNKDGSFVRQFKPRAGEAVSFANLQDIFVDEIGGRLYILDSNNLYVGNIPNE